VIRTSYPFHYLVSMFHPRTISTLLAITFSLSVFAQGPWTQKAGFPGNARHRPFTFSIGNRGYLGCGWNGVTMYNDFWEYDPGSDTWIQKANYPGGPRLSAFGFSIGNKGYAGTGLDASLWGMGDVYEYNPATNTWTPKASFPATPIFGSTVATVGNVAYIFFGDEWDPTYWRHNEVYAFNTSTNTWSYLTTLPADGRRDAVGFAIGTKIYVGTGNDNSYNEDSDWWEYNTVSGLWAQKAMFAGVARSQAVGFAVDGKGYVGTGGIQDVTDFWKYDPVTNAWNQIDDFPGQGRENSSTFVIGNKAYLAVGTSGTNFADLWEFNPQNITGIEKEIPENAFSIFPNPMKTTATIELKNSSAEDHHLQIFDAQGKLVREENFSGTAFTLERNNLPAGIYLCRLISGDGKSLETSLIMQ
jgi:N-acetylneuraminic acid mutarotase